MNVILQGILIFLFTNFFLIFFFGLISYTTIQQFLNTNKISYSFSDTKKSNSISTKATIPLECGAKIVDFSYFYNHNCQELVLLCNIQLLKM